MNDPFELFGGVDAAIRHAQPDSGDTITKDRPGDDAPTDFTGTEYRGTSEGNGGTLVVRQEKGRKVEKLPLEPSLRLRDHSPTGFSWGYEGSGPAQLALALLLDATNDEEIALRWYQGFKSDVVAKWPFNGRWRLHRGQILDWLTRAEKAEQDAHDAGDFRQL